MGLEYRKELATIYSELAKSLIDDETFISNTTEKAITWIVGLSTGSIALIISERDKLLAMPKSTVSVVLALFVSAMCTLLASRVISIFLVRKTFHILRHLEIRVNFEHAKLKQGIVEYTDEEAKAHKEDFLHFDRILGETFGNSAEEWEQRKQSSRYMKPTTRRCLQITSSILYVFGIILFLSAVILFTWASIDNLFS